MQREYPSEEELIRFFGSEPLLSDADCPWYFNILTYSTCLDTAQLLCTLKPSYGEMSCQIFDAGQELTDFTLHNVAKVSISQEGDHSIMAIEFSHSLKACPVHLQLQPKLKICRGLPVS